jgi:hypothetical protein
MNPPDDGAPKKPNLGAVETQVVDLEDVVLTDLPLPSEPELSRAVPPPLPPVSPSLPPPAPVGRSKTFYVALFLAVGVVGGAVGLGMAMSLREPPPEPSASPVSSLPSAAEPPPAVITIPAVEIGDEP